MRGRPSSPTSPGLIEGASEGAGLGHRFLAHIERTALLMYVLDGGDGPEAWPVALDTLRGELGAFRAELLERPAVVLVNKADLLDDAGRDAAEEFLAGLDWPAATRRRLRADRRRSQGARRGELQDVMERARAAQAEAEAAAEAAPAADGPAPGRGTTRVVHRGAPWTTTSSCTASRWSGCSRRRTSTTRTPSRYLQQVIERAGLNDALRRAGAVPGDTVVVGQAEFEFA